MTAVAIWLGTLILYVPTQTGSFVSADSRHDGGHPALRDQARKIFLCGQSAVCAVSGGLRLDVTSANGVTATLDIAALLAEASAALRTDSNQSPQHLLVRLRDSLQEKVQAFWNSHLTGVRLAAPLSQRLGAPSVCTILFAAPGLIAQMQFPITERRTPDGLWLHELRPPAIRYSDPARPLAQGHVECIVPPIHLPETAGEMEALYAPATQAPFCRDVIGGPVDIAFIESGGGARWLRLKLLTPKKVDEPAPLAVH